MEEYKGLLAAAQVVRKLRLKVHDEDRYAWERLYNVSQYLEKRIVEMGREMFEEVAA